VTYEGVAELVDCTGGCHVVHACLDVDVRDGGWTGVLTSALDWSTLTKERIVLELPEPDGRRLALRSLVQIDLVVGEHQAVAHGHAQMLVPAGSARRTVQHAS
jgi:hypothetical protein